MGTDEELILALCPAHRRFIADAVGLRRRHLAVRKRMPDLVEKRPVSGPAVSFPPVSYTHLVNKFDGFPLSVGKRERTAQKRRPLTLPHLWPR